jgi:hypothetical protein
VKLWEKTMQTREEFLKTEEAVNLKAVWQSAVEKIPTEPTPGKFPLFQVNFRVDLLKALRATWEAAKVTVETIVAAHVVFDPVIWAGIGLEAVSAVRSVVSSLIETMQPIDYITYVILSQTSGGIDKSALKTSVETFLARPESIKFSWYLGMSEGLVERAKEVVESPDWIDDVIGRLAKKNMVGLSGTQLIFQPRNFTIGWESE